MRLGYDSCTSLLSSVSGINVKIDLGGEGELCTMYAYDDIVYTGMLSGFFSHLNCSFSSSTGISSGFGTSISLLSLGWMEIRRIGTVFLKNSFWAKAQLMRRYDG